MAQPAGPDSADWQRRWTIEAESVTLQPVTRRMARAVLDGGPITRQFEEGSMHDRIPQAMGFALRDIDPARPPCCRPSGSSSAAPTGGSLAIWAPTARPTVRAASRSAEPRPVRAWPERRHRRRGRPGQAPGGGARDPPAYRGHQCTEHRVPAPARTPGIPPHGPASGHRRGALHAESQLAGHAIPTPAPPTELQDQAPCGPVGGQALARPSYSRLRSAWASPQPVTATSRARGMMDA